MKPSSPASIPVMSGSLVGIVLFVVSLPGGADVASPGADWGRTGGRTAGQVSDPVLDSVKARIPEELAGSARTALDIGTEAGVTSVTAVFEGGGGPVPRIEVTVARGLAAQRSAHERFVVGIRQQGRVRRTELRGVPVFRGTAKGHAFAVGFPGQFVVAVSGEVADGARQEEAIRTLERALRRVHAAAVSPLLRGRGSNPGSEARSAAGFVHSTVVWEELSFSLGRPTAWSVSDLGASSRLPRALVLTRDPDVPGDGFRAALQPSGGDTLSLGSDENVAVVLSYTGAGEGPDAPADLLRGIRRSDLVAGMLVEGRATGPVARRSAGRDSLASFPFRGRDREGREIRGWFYAVPVESRILRGQILVGPTAPTAAVDTAGRAMASVAGAGGGDGR